MREILFTHFDKGFEPEYDYWPIRHFHSRVEQIYKFIGAKETIDTREEFKHLNTSVAIIHCFAKQYSRCDVMLVMVVNST